MNTDPAKLCGTDPWDREVHVIIPTHHRPALLHRALESVFKQSVLPSRVIIVEDGSRDTDVQVLKDLLGNAPVPVTIIYQAHQGVSAARNRGINEVCSGWVALLDSDDEWKRTCLEKKHAFLNKNPKIRWIHSDEVWRKNGVHLNQLKKHEKKGGDIFAHSLPFCRVSPSAVMMERSIFDQYGYFDEDFPVCEDYDLWLRIALWEPIGFVTEALTIKHGGHEDQLSKSRPFLDLYRLKALHKLNRFNLRAEEKKLVVDEIQRKTKHLRLGAIKHNNANLLVEIENLHMV